MLYQIFRGLDGQRSVEDRWEVIKPHIVGNTLVDIGSAEGAFSILSLEELGIKSILSIEQVKESVDEHIKLLNGKKSLICNSCLTEDVLLKMYNSCFYSDVILLMSVLHWYKNPEKVLEYICSIGNIIICETPSVNDIGACGQDVVQKNIVDIIYKVGKKLNKQVEIIGKVKSHTTPEVYREVYKISGLVDRGILNPYIMYNGDKKSCLSVILNKNNYISGFNLLDLFYLNLIYPNKQNFIEQITNIFNSSKDLGLTDFGLWNFIVDNSKIYSIDFNDKLYKEWSKDDLDDAIKILMNKKTISEYYNDECNKRI